MLANPRFLMALAIVVTSVASGNEKAVSAGAAEGQSWLRAIVAKENEPREFGPWKWLDEGAAYTTIEDSPSIKDAKDIVRYTTASGARKVMISAAQLTPADAPEPLAA
mgnify:CR=1 FL=1